MQFTNISFKDEYRPIVFRIKDGQAFQGNEKIVYYLLFREKSGKLPIKAKG